MRGAGHAGAVFVGAVIKVVGSADMSPDGRLAGWFAPTTEIGANRKELRPQAEHALAEEAHFATLDPVQAESYRVLRSRIDLSALPPLTRAVTEAVLCATADFDYVTDLACDEAVLVAGVRAIAAGVPVVADAPAVVVGITGCPVICKAGEALAVRLARTTGITLAAAAVRLGFGEAGPGAVWVVGGAADALAEILRRVVEPALVIGVPAGFAGAAAVKDELRASGMPALSNMSEKGGPVVAAAAFAALLRAARGEPWP